MTGAGLPTWPPVGLEAPSSVHLCRERAPPLCSVSAVARSRVSPSPPWGPVALLSVKTGRHQLAHDSGWGGSLETGHTKNGFKKGFSTFYFKTISNILKSCKNSTKTAHVFFT